MGYEQYFIIGRKVGVVGFPQWDILTDMHEGREGYETCLFMLSNLDESYRGYKEIKICKTIYEGV